MPVSAVKTRLGNDVSLWSQLLNEAKAARDVVENSNREKVFGPVIIDYSNVQAKVPRSALMNHQQGWDYWVVLVVIAVVGKAERYGSFWDVGGRILR